LAPHDAVGQGAQAPVDIRANSVLALNQMIPLCLGQLSGVHAFSKQALEGDQFGNAVLRIGRVWIEFRALSIEGVDHLNPRKRSSTEIYKQGADSGFSGRVTNVPEHVILDRREGYWPFRDALRGIVAGTRYKDPPVRHRIGLRCLELDRYCGDRRPN
jgi:hypothetical protein